MEPFCAAPVAVSYVDDITMAKPQVTTVGVQESQSPLLVSLTFWSNVSFPPHSRICRLPSAFDLMRTFSWGWH